MSNHDLRDKLDGIHSTKAMDTVYPEAMSRLHRGIGVSVMINARLSISHIFFSFKCAYIIYKFQQPAVIEHNPQNYKRKVKKNMDRRGRFRTQPVTFMEIKVMSKY